ncbi:protein FAR1-RELATED SEQUENCE 5 isoform X2 [Brachypodium distachyon]|uniref:protein FAR1-RELATED SEQUENCE 5 isoform X2 n=1 Tax=Brachypodium distachyon TaxID=15368 RepID=UPI0006E4A9BD|nr:protein FAR1-RELATED SEQUENCE 5 isoform X2 [Brachypodium distachyon]|eukprot:XP_014753177.1 protein FAR1-RELATED SEQUENCE 5 isoform X2 [Brachypodium distachyon]
MIRLLRTEDHGWFVSRLVNEHTHPLSESCGEKKQWNSHSVIDPLTKDFIKNLRYNNVSAGKIFSIVGAGDGSGMGVPFRRQTLKSLCARLARESIDDDMTKTIRILQDLSSKDPNFSVRVEVDEGSRVKTVLWCNGKNKIDYAHFGDVLTFDTTYRTNLYNMPFALFVGVNEHYQSTIFGGVLLRDEKIPSFEWAFSTFVELMNGKHPVTMLTDQCQSMEAAIRKTLPMTRHRWCKCHVLRAAKEKIGHVYSKRYGFKRDFHDLIINETSAEKFEHGWTDLVATYELGDNSFLERIYNKRSMWAKPYFMETLCAGMTSTQRSESANHLLKMFIPRSSPMHLFIRQYNNMFESRLSDEQQQIHKRRLLKQGVPIELDAAVVYTKAMYERFSLELFNSGSLVVSKALPGSVFKVRTADSYVTSEYDDKEYTVQIEEGGRFVQCDCGFF